MHNQTVTQELVDAACESLTASNRRVTLSQVHRHLGGGSRTTVCKMVRAWRERRPEPVDCDFSPTFLGALRKLVQQQVGLLAEEYREESSSLAEEAEEFQRLLHEAKQREEALAAELNEYRQRYEDGSRNHERAAAEYERRILDLERTLSYVVSERDVAQQSATDLRALTEELRSQYDTSTAAVAESAATVAALTSRNDELSKALEERGQKVDSLRAEHESLLPLTYEVEALRRREQSLETSLSQRDAQLQLLVETIASGRSNAHDHRSNDRAPERPAAKNQHHPKRRSAVVTPE